MNDTDNETAVKERKTIRLSVHERLIVNVKYGHVEREWEKINFHISFSLSRFRLDKKYIYPEFIDETASDSWNKNSQYIYFLNEFSLQLF